VAVGVLVLVAILLVVGVRGCLGSQQKQALKTYNSEATSLANESRDQVSTPFFDTLSSSAGQNPIQLQTTLNGYRAAADDIVKRARKLDVPDAMQPAQRNLVLAYELRRDAVGKVAEKLPDALGRENATTALKQTAGQMTAFLASDVIYSQRVVPLITTALANDDITDQEVAKSQFLPSIEWLDAGKLGTSLGSSAQVTSSGKPLPGRHGHGLTAVSVNGVDLAAGESNRVPAQPLPVFSVRFMNQGENDETNVVTTATLKDSASGKQVATVSKTTPSTRPGSEATVEIPLQTAPPTGAALTLEIEVKPVPGEKNVDNNKGSYPIFFEG
jgi:hypothetical protein